jgi:hypothetical protein
MTAKARRGRLPLAHAGAWCSARACPASAQHRSRCRRGRWAPRPAAPGAPARPAARSPRRPRTGPGRARAAAAPVQPRRRSQPAPALPHHGPRRCAPRPPSLPGWSCQLDRRQSACGALAGCMRARPGARCLRLRPYPPRSSSALQRRARAARARAQRPPAGPPRRGQGRGMSRPGRVGMRSGGPTAGRSMHAAALPRAVRLRDPGPGCTARVAAPAAQGTSSRAQALLRDAGPRHASRARGAACALTCHGMPTGQPCVELAESSEGPADTEVSARLGQTLSG